MPFTEEDAQNDGRIVRDVGDKLNSVMARESPTLYDYFSEWCAENDRDPATELGQMVVSALNDEAYATTVANTVVTLNDLQTESVKMQDLELIEEVVDRFGENASDSGPGVDLDSIIQKRIESVGTGPLGGMTADQQNAGGQRVESLNEKMDKLIDVVAAQQTQTTSTEPDRTVTVDDSSDEEIDNLFAGAKDVPPDSDTDGGETIDFDSASANTADAEPTEQTDTVDMESRGLDDEADEEAEA